MTTIDEMLKNWMDMLLKDKPRIMTVADFETDTSIYIAAQNYRKSLGKTEAELPNDHILVSMRYSSSNPNETFDAYDNIQVSFTIQDVQKLS